MKTYRHIESESGTLALRFISCYQGIADYGVSLCRALPGQYEARVSWNGSAILPAVSPETFLKEHGFTFEAASNAVRAFIAERFDADVRECVRLGIMEFADASVKARALELQLVAS